MHFPSGEVMATQKPNERLHELNLGALVPEHHNIFENKVPTKFTDPCKDAALQSMRCLERFAHDKTQCHNEFLI